MKKLLILGLIPLNFLLQGCAGGFNELGQISRAATCKQWEASAKQYDEYDKKWTEKNEYYVPDNFTNEQRRDEERWIKSMHQEVLNAYEEDMYRTSPYSKAEYYIYKKCVVY